MDVYKHGNSKTKMNISHGALSSDICLFPEPDVKERVIIDRLKREINSNLKACKPQLIFTLFGKGKLIY